MGERRRALLAASRRRVRLHPGRAAAGHRRRRASHARAGRRLHLPRQYTAHLPRDPAGKPHPGALGSLACPARHRPRHAAASRLAHRGSMSLAFRDGLGHHGRTGTQSRQRVPRRQGASTQPWWSPESLRAWRRWAAANPVPILPPSGRIWPGAAPPAREHRPRAAVSDPVPGGRAAGDRAAASRGGPPPPC